MKIWASVETYRVAGPALGKIYNYVIPYLNDAISKSPLSDLNIIIHYVPIVMPDFLRQNYPARSRLRVKKSIYVAAPQLNYDVFLPGCDQRDQVIEYMSGLLPVAPYLIKLGASTEQAKLYVDILVAARKALCEGLPRVGGD